MFSLKAWCLSESVRQDNARKVLLILYVTNPFRITIEEILEGEFGFDRELGNWGPDSHYSNKSILICK